MPPWLYFIVKSVQLFTSFFHAGDGAAQPEVALNDKADDRRPCPGPAAARRMGRTIHRLTTGITHSCMTELTLGSLFTTRGAVNCETPLSLEICSRFIMS
jgi:hypothetical protein